MDENGPEEEMDFTIDLIEGIEEGHNFPFRFYESGDQKRTMSHSAYNALGVVLDRLDNIEPCYRKYKENLKKEKEEEEMKAELESLQKIKGKEKVREVKVEVKEEVKEVVKEEEEVEVPLIRGHLVVDVGGQRG
ncbi:Signal-induced proliferation-associated protein 1 [Bienertia sinuspersici]